MISEKTIYCVGCSSIVDKEKAEKIFRTGFYKVSMRLGICNECENATRFETVCMMDVVDHQLGDIDETMKH